MNTDSIELSELRAWLSLLPVLLLFSDIGSSTLGSIFHFDVF